MWTELRAWSLRVSIPMCSNLHRRPRKQNSSLAPGRSSQQRAWVLTTAKSGCLFQSERHHDLLRVTAILLRSKCAPTYPRGHPTASMPEPLRRRRPPSSRDRSLTSARTRSTKATRLSLSVNRYRWNKHRLNKGETKRVITISSSNGPADFNRGC